MSVVALLDELAREHQRGDRPALIGLGGSQGSGKSHVARAFAEGRNVAHFSLDDVYLTRGERQALARDVHPLLATRGPPGTHDLTLAAGTIESLRSGAETHIPLFDKRSDDRRPKGEWRVFRGRPEIILMEGWCMGALPLEDAPAPINALEAEEDPDGRWRRSFAERLAGDYQRFFNRFDAFVYLKAPSFEIVQAWRAEQEAKTLGRPLTEAERAWVARFIQHYERITRAMIAGPHRASATVHLDESRRVVSIERRPEH